MSTTARLLERDLGVSIRDAIYNAGETGVEEQMDQVVDVAKAISSGHGVPGQGQSQFAALA